MSTADRPRLAIIDNDGSLLMGLAKLFRYHGWESTAVATAEQAFAYIGSAVQDPPDAVVLDLRMDERSGVDITRVIRHNRRRSRRTGLPIRVVLYTASVATDPMVEDAIRAGVDAVVFKSSNYGNFDHLEAVVKGEHPGDVPIPPGNVST